jgi:hypothetical protein
MSEIFDIAGGAERDMSYEEKGTWVYLVVSVVVYAAYVGVILSRAGGGPVADVAYVAPLLWTIAASIVAAIVARIVVETVRPSESYRSDERDRELARQGVAVGWWGVVGGPARGSRPGDGRGRPLLDRERRLPRVRALGRPVVGDDDRRLPPGRLTWGASRRGSRTPSGRCGSRATR